jgi:integrase
MAIGNLLRAVSNGRRFSQMPRRLPQHAAAIRGLPDCSRSADRARAVLDTNPGISQATTQAVVAAIGSDMRRFSSAAAQHLAQWEALWVLGITIGMRPGELLALTWHQVDLDAPAPFLRVLASLARDATGRWGRFRLRRRPGAVLF